MEWFNFLNSECMVHKMNNKQSFEAKRQVHSGQGQVMF